MKKYLKLTLLTTCCIFSGAYIGGELTYKYIHNKKMLNEVHCNLISSMVTLDKLESKNYDTIKNNHINYLKNTFITLVYFHKSGNGDDKTVKTLFNAKEKILKYRQVINEQEKSFRNKLNKADKYTEKLIFLSETQLKDSLKYVSNLEKKEKYL